MVNKYIREIILLYWLEGATLMIGTNKHIKYILYGVLYVVFLLMHTVCVDAQLLQDQANWIKLSGRGSFDSFSPKLAHLLWWLDTDVRFFARDDGLGQVLVRPGIGLALTDSTSFWIGYTRVFNKPFNVIDNDKNEIWQQFIWAGFSGKWHFKSRTRLEQRMQIDNNTTNWRLRESFKVTYPLLASKRLAFATYDEVFFHLNETNWAGSTGFSQNRLFIGLNTSLDVKHHIQAEFGYLNRYLQHSVSNQILDHIVSFKILFNYL